LFCHNGRIFGYQLIKRRFLAELSDEAFLHIKGTTDSEGVFGLILTILAQDDSATESPLTQTTPFGAHRLCAAVKKALSRIQQIQDDADLPHRDYSTCNFALTDGETMVVTRYCDYSPTVPPPSLYFAFGCSLSEELTSETQETTPIKMPVSRQDSSDEEKKENTSSDGSVGDDDTSSSDEDFETSKVLLHKRESKPGKILSQVDPENATFVVSSNPLTRTHCWHKIPKNSIMWCTRGKHPELRMLVKKPSANTHNRHISIGEYPLV
jgi:glutamine amidotransferase